MAKKTLAKMANGKIKKAVSLVRKRGLTGLVSFGLSRIVGKKPLPISPIQNYQLYYKLLNGEKGLEIGGPSRVFERNNILPIYPIIGGLDGCNFSSNTVWEGTIQQGESYRYDPHKKPGYQYICEASDLEQIPSGYYDFVLSSHSIEHVANPLKAVKEWTRVLKKDGVLLIIVPDKSRTFDHKRPTTSFEHLLEDYKNNIDEHDLTHLPEIIELHDLSMDPPAGDTTAFKTRSLKNFENRCLHHHVFDPPLITKVLDYADIQVLDVVFVKPYHIIAVGKKR